MTSSNPDLRDLADGQLLTEVKRLAACERHAMVALIAALAEVDRRRLYLDEGYASLFTYSTDVLRLSESAAYRRIEAARVVRRFPIVLQRLAAGDVTLTTITLLAAHLTAENIGDLLDRATRRKKREVELLIATLHPQPDVRSIIRKLPVAQPAVRGGGRGGTTLASEASIAEMPPAPRQSTATVPARASAASRPAVVTPLAPARYKLQVTIGEETQRLLRHAQDLLRHAIPDGDLEAVLHRALTLLVEDAERRRCAATRRPRGAARATSPASTPRPARTASDVELLAAIPQPLAGVASSAAADMAATKRHIPAAVKREVWRRDEARCAFVSRDGHRCGETGKLEYHHVTPWAVGGQPTVEGLSLRCKAHNLREAERFFGEEHMRIARAGPDHERNANATRASAS